jgi:predicted acyltransferase
MSLDALRGFDMFWIVGAGAIVKALRSLRQDRYTRYAAEQLQHVTWVGFHFYDLIFPLFLFIVGTSMVFSLNRELERGGTWSAVRRIVVRSLLLYVLGVLYYGGLSRPWPEVQLAGVLQRIAACYLMAALIYCLVRSMAGLFAVAAGLLLGYWAVLALVPFPDLTLTRANVEALAARIDSDAPGAIAAAVPERIHGVYQEGRNLTNFVDFLYLPGKKPQVYYINEGLLSTLPSVALPLFGAMAGLLLQRPSLTPRQRVLWLIGGGAAGVLIGLAWSVEFPLIKRVWTSSFVVLTAGLSALLLAVFYEVVDVRRWRAWSQPFVWIGCNALTMYLAVQVVSFPKLASYLVGGDVKTFLDTHAGPGTGNVALAVVGLALVIGMARFLYARGIFLRV